MRITRRGFGKAILGVLALPAALEGLTTKADGVWLVRPRKKGRQIPVSVGSEDVFYISTDKDIYWKFDGVDQEFFLPSGNFHLLWNLSVDRVTVRTKNGSANVRIFVGGKNEGMGSSLRTAYQGGM